MRMIVLRSNLRSQLRKGSQNHNLKAFQRMNGIVLNMMNIHQKLGLCEYMQFRVRVCVYPAQPEIRLVEAYRHFSQPTDSFSPVCVFKCLLKLFDWETYHHVGQPT